jgi:hypothetical protein
MASALPWDPLPSPLPSIGYDKRSRGLRHGPNAHAYGASICKTMRSPVCDPAFELGFGSKGHTQQLLAGVPFACEGERSKVETELAKEGTSIIGSECSKPESAESHPLLLLPLLCWSL